MSLEALKKRYWEARSHLRSANPAAWPPLASSLREFFRERVTVERAEEEIKKALDHRERSFLELARTRIYECPDSPYLKLLRIAGCEFSDLQMSVRRHGVEGALERLAREGVYLTSDEFKGKREVARAGHAFRVSPDRFERRDAPSGFATISSGTRNRPVRSFIPLDWLAARTWAVGVFFSAHDLFSYSHAVYDAILPGSSAVNHLLINARLGKRTDRWFARKIPTPTWLDATYHYLTTYVIVLAGKGFGPGFPRPEFIEIADLHRIVRWISETKRRGGACYITTISSSASRIAQVAAEMGVSLEGTKFNVAGEPFTEAKHEAIKRVGASATSRYAYGGGMNVGFGCANPLHRDEIHVNQHLLAVISHTRPLSGGASPIYPLLCSTVHPTAPRLLLNVENGDYVTLEKRSCGCALERVGLTLHLHGIRSFEKFTSEGMNYFYGDLYELFEKTLPAEFGGGPGDYQLVEEEDGTGQTRLTLVVHPEVGQVDEERLLARLREALEEGSWGNRFQSTLWQAAETFRLARRVPHASPRGKILPLHFPK